MAMDVVALNVGANAIAADIDFIGLIDDVGVEISGGTYARQAVTWTSASAGKVNPTSDLPFNIPAGNTVAEWRGFTAVTGGTSYGGEPLTPQAFVTDGTYTLLAASTAIDLNAV